MTQTAEAGDGSVSMEGMNFLLQAFWSVLAADKPQRQALRLLDDVGIDVDREDVVQAAGDVDSVEDFPASWRRDFNRNWTWQTPLLEVMLPIVAEVLWQRWAPEVPRPHSIKRDIVAGRRHLGDAPQTFEHWARAFGELMDWLAGREPVADDELVAWLDRALQLDDGIDGWIDSVLETTREIVGDEEPTDDGVPTALQILEDIADVWESALPGAANDAAVFRYAALLDAGDEAAALQTLQRLRNQPLADHHAALYLCDLVVKWGYRAPPAHLEQITGIADRSIDESSGDAAAEVEDARQQLLEMSGAAAGDD